MPTHLETDPHQAFRRTVRAQALAVASQQLADVGWDRVHMAGIAKAIGVSRPTLYAEFGRMEGLAEALVMTEAERFLDGIEAILRANDDQPLHAIEAAVAYAMAEAERSPILLAILTSGRAEGPHSETLLTFITVRAESILAILTDGTVKWFRRQCPNTPPEQVVEAVDALVRLLISYLMSPSSHPEQTPGMFVWLTARMLPELGAS